MLAFVDVDLVSKDPERIARSGLFSGQCVQLEGGNVLLSGQIAANDGGDVPDVGA